MAEDKKTFYLTTPIYYPSGQLHIGHAYTTVASDAMIRYKKLQGYDTYFLTGTDEHGQKIQQKAQEAGVSEIEFVDNIIFGIQDLWKKLDVSYDDFIRTTQPRHKKSVQKIFQKLMDNGDIYLGEYEGWYSVSDEEYFTESQLVEVYRDADGKMIGGVAPSGHEVQLVKEESYFFRMSKYADRLLQYYEEHPEFIQPESRKNEMINNFIKPGLEDLAVSRTSFDWGIPVPNDPKHVIYVWIDALSNYITALGYGSDDETLFNRYWPADVHFIGKEIVRFHTIYWPIMLMALGEPLPKQVFGHPWLLIGDSKMSKSHGNVIYADDLVKLFGVDAVRFIMLHEMPFAQDGHVTYDLMIERINSDLANNLGNLVNRTISMQNKYFGGVVANPNVSEPIDDELKAMATDTVKKVIEKMDELRVADAIQDILDLFSRCNKYIDETTPWALAKDSEKIERLATVLYNLLESVRIAAVLMESFFPETSKKILDDLNTQQRDFATISEFGKLETGIHVAEKPEILFARIDEKAIQSKIDMINEINEKARKKEIEKKPTVTVEDFQKIDLRVGKVLSCERHPDADKLFVLKVDLGDGEVRQIVSGLAQSYTPGQVIGKSIVMIANLQPTVIRGVESQGMLLAGKEEKTIGLVEVNGLTPGTKVQ